METDLEIIILSEVSQKEKNKHHMIPLTQGNLKYGKNKPIYKRETDSQTERTDLWLLRGKGDKGRMDWEFGISGCKVLYTGWINNQVYSTGNYIRCPVINHDGKEYEKEYIYIMYIYIYIYCCYYC